MGFPMSEISEYEAVVMLDLSDDEREALQQRVNELERGFTALEIIDTENTEPLVTVLNIRNVLRDDIAKKHFSRDEILANAPEQYDGFFQVPGTIN